MRGLPLSWPQGRTARTAVSVAVLAIVYAALAAVGRSFVVHDSGVALFWPPAGLAMWWVWRARRGTRTAHLLGGVAGGNLIGNLLSGAPAPLLPVFVVANVAETVAGVVLLSIVTSNPPQESQPRARTLHDIRAIAVAAVVPPALGATIAHVGIAAATGSPLGPPSDWRVWFVADGLGILVVLTSFVSVRDVIRASITRRLLAEAAFVALAQAAVLVLSVSHVTPVAGSDSWPYYLIPALFWAAARLGPAITACLSAATVTTVIVATALGAGPFAAVDDVQQRLLEVQFFVAVVVFASAAMANMVRDNSAVENLISRRTIAMEYALDGIGYVAGDGRLLSMNPAMAAMVERVKGDLVGGQWSGIVLEDDMPLAVAALAGMRSNGSSSTLLRLHGRDGGIVRFELTLVADTTPGARGHHIFARDVTERDAAREHLDSLFRLSPDLLSVTDRGLLISANPAWETVLGHPLDELVGSNLLEYFHPDDLERTRAQVARMAHEPTTTDFDIRFRAAEGEYIWLRWNAVRDHERGLTYSVGHDLTAIKQTQEALAAARDEALEASRLKSQFLATMSHEIRTPLNGVIGLGELLADTTLDETQRRYATGIVTAGTTLLTLINEVLDFSKIEAGKFVLDEVDFELASVLADVMAICGQAAQAKGLVLDIVVEPDLPAGLRGDPTRVRQILLNLVGNAIKFTEVGRVRVHARQATGDGPLHIEVTDTGRGIDPALVGTLFQRFSQIDADPGLSGGAGLGLAISQQLAEAMRGGIEVESRLGQGATFRLTLPLSPARTAHKANVAAAERLRVLVVDDNEDGRASLEQQLLSWGMYVEGAAGGEAALAVLHRDASMQRRFDVAILDMVMPGCSGAELAADIAADPQIPALPTILLTSGEALSAYEADRAGIMATLTKPVTRSTLYDALVHVTRMPAGRGPGPVRGRVLLVEDNEINQVVATGILTRLGYTIDVAVDGIDAIEMATRQAYQVILMDVQMPRMDGYATARHLRAMPATRRTPIVAMTANAHTEARTLCLDAGMNDYITKPIRAHDLEATLVRWTSAPDGGLGRDVSPTVPRIPPQRQAGIDERLTELLGEGSPRDYALVKTIVMSFLQRAPQMVVDLGGAMQRSHRSEMVTLAHSLRGAAANLGADRLAEACERIETVSPAIDAAGVGDAGPALLAQLDQTVGELQGWLDEHA